MRPPDRASIRQFTDSRPTIRSRSFTLGRPGWNRGEMLRTSLRCAISAKGVNQLRMEPAPFRVGKRRRPGE